MLRLTFFLWLVLVEFATAWTVSTTTTSSSRRTVLLQSPFLLFPTIARAVERRDVGDSNASADTKALNMQAYETNSRLEREGFKLETAAEQSATLQSALSDLSYSDKKLDSKTKKGGKK